MRKIKIAIVGVGNCSSSLIQGIHYYLDKRSNDAIGLMHWDIGGFKPFDIEVVAAVAGVQSAALSAEIVPVDRGKQGHGVRLDGFMDIEDPIQDINGGLGGLFGGHNRLGIGLLHCLPHSQDQVPGAEVGVVSAAM